MQLLLLRTTNVISIIESKKSGDGMSRRFGSVQDVIPIEWTRWRPSEGQVGVSVESTNIHRFSLSWIQKHYHQHKHSNNREKVQTCIGISSGGAKRQQDTLLIRGFDSCSQRQRRRQQQQNSQKKGTNKNSHGLHQG